MKPLNRSRYTIRPLEVKETHWLYTPDYSNADEAVIIRHPHIQWVGRAYRFADRWFLVACLGNVISCVQYPRPSFSSLDGACLHFAMAVELRREELRAYNEWADKAYPINRKEAARA